jgi:hypothetical protein
MGSCRCGRNGDAETVHALGQLIADCKAVNRWSNGDIARQSDGRVTRTRVQQLEKDPIKAMPTLQVVEGLALGLRVPGWVVVATILETMGYPSRPSRVSIEEAIDSDPSLSDADRGSLRGYLAGLRVKSRMEVVTDGKPQPRRQEAQQAGSAPKTEDEPDDVPEVLTEKWVRERGWAAHVVQVEEVETSDNMDQRITPPSS